jgi:hypothetical protein
LLHEEKNIKGFVSLFIYWYKLKIREVRYPSFGVCYRTMIMRGIVLPPCYCYDKLKSRRKGALPLPSFVPILKAMYIEPLTGNSKEIKGFVIL